MELEKICPTCKKPNPAYEVMCQFCMADVAGVGPTPPAKKQEGPIQGADPVPKQVPEQVPGPPPPDSGNQASQENADAGKTKVFHPGKLRLKLDNFEFEIEDGDVVGRNFVGKAILAQFPGVSRQHARFSFDNGRWFVEDLGSTNGTLINGVALKPREKSALKIGDKLGISKKVAFEVVSV